MDILKQHIIKFVTTNGAVSLKEIIDNANNFGIKDIEIQNLVLAMIASGKFKFTTGLKVVLDKNT